MARRGNKGRECSPRGVNLLANAFNFCAFVFIYYR